MERVKIDDFAKIQYLSDLTCSPNGKVLAFVKSGNGHHEDKLGAKMEGQVVQIVAILKGKYLFSNFQSHQKARHDLKRNQPDLDVLFAD